MRRQMWIVGGLIAGVVVGGTARGAAGWGEDAKALQVMKDAREALGGEGKLAALKGLSIRADFRRALSGVMGGGGAVVIMRGPGGGAGGGQITGSIAIDVMFPDRFYREETSSSGIALTRIDGFEGDRPFLDVVANSPGIRVMADRPADDPARAKGALRRANTDLARLLLGLIAGTHGGLPVSYTYAGEAESAETVADVIDVTGPDGFKARLFIDSSTHHPLMLTFMEPEARPVRMVTRHSPEATGHRGNTSSATPATSKSGSSKDKQAPPELTPEQRAEIDKEIAALEADPPKLVEYRVFFADYREIEGISLPHRISRAAADETIEEWEIKEYRVNPNIKPDRFKVGTE